MRNAIKLIKSFFNENCNHYYYQVLLEKYLYKQYRNPML